MSISHRTAPDRFRRKPYTAGDLRRIRRDCVAINLARANRIVGRMYEDAFREVGVTAPQFALLVSLYIQPNSSASELSHELGSDPSTVSRNTELLIRRGLLSSRPCTEDRRIRRYCLSPAGETLIQESVPQWQYAQRHALHMIGRPAWDGMLHALRRLVSW